MYRQMIGSQLNPVLTCASYCGTLQLIFRLEGFQSYSRVVLHS